MPIEWETNSNEELVRMHLRDLKDNPARRENIALEMNRRLIVAINNFNKSSSKQTTQVLILTWAMFITALSQIGLLIFQLFTQSPK